MIINILYYFYRYKTDNEFMAKYMPTKIIGKGPRANIIEAVAKSTGEKYAVKIIDKRTVDDIDTFRSNLNLAIAVYKYLVLTLID